MLNLCCALSENAHLPKPQAHEFVLAITQEIEGHLMRYPRASDTAWGIWQWWLRETGARADLEDVEAALGQLVCNGVVNVRQMPSGERLYFGSGEQEESS